MSDILTFEGTVLRVERDGFTIVAFEKPIGPSANRHRLISSSTGTTSVPFNQLKPGVHVVGTAEPNDGDIASIKTITTVQKS